MVDSFAIADQYLLAPYELNTVRLRDIFGQILTHRIDYADIYFQYNRSEGWVLEEGIVKSGSFSIDQELVSVQSVEKRQRLPIQMISAARLCFLQRAQHVQLPPKAVEHRRV